MAGRKKSTTKIKPKKSIKRNSKRKIKKNKIKFNKSRVLVIGFLVVLLMILIGITFSYAFWFMTDIQQNHNEVTAGCLSFSLDDKDVDGNVTNINLPNAYPMRDEIGLRLSPYILKITNTCTLQTNIFISLHNLDSSGIDSKYIKVSLQDENDNFVLDPTLVSNITGGKYSNDITTAVSHKLNNIKETHLLNNFLLDPDETITVNMRMWIDYNANNDIMGLSYNSAVSVYATTPE